MFFCRWIPFCSVLCKWFPLCHQVAAPRHDWGCNGRCSVHPASSVTCRETTSGWCRRCLVHDDRTKVHCWLSSAHWLDILLFVTCRSACLASMSLLSSVATDRLDVDAFGRDIARQEWRHQQWQTLCRYRHFDVYISCIVSGGWNKCPAAGTYPDY